MRVTPEDFIVIWQRSENMNEVMSHMPEGYSRGCAQVRAYRYRKRGIPLKRFPSGKDTNKLEVKRLKALAELTNVNKRI